MTSRNTMQRFARMAVAAGSLAAVVVLFGCSSAEPQGELLHIQEDQFEIGNLSHTRAWATGIGCAGTMNDAVLTAQRIAEFNLRSLTGPARYRIVYRKLRDVPDASKACVEVEAQASALQMR